MSDLTQKLRTAGDDDKVQPNLLKDLAGIERGDEMPSTAAVASLAFLFLTRKHLVELTSSQGSTLFSVLYEKSVVGA